MNPDPNRQAETATGSDGPALVRRSMVGAGIGLVLFIGGVGGYLLARASMSHRPVAATPAPTKAETAPGSAQRQTAARRLAALAAADFSPLDPLREARHGFVAPIVMSPPYETVNSAVFDTAEYRVRLARIRPLGRGEVCFDRSQFRFACGLMGRAALQNVLAGREVACLPRFEVSSTDGHRFSADCRTEAGDLAETLVRLGFALPTDPDDRRLAAMLGEAQSARRGIWMGPYVEAATDPTAEDEGDLPFVGARPREAATDPPAPAGIVELRPGTAGGAGSEASGASPPSSARPLFREKPRRSADAPARRTPTLEELAPNATLPGGVNVVAGPIRPPSPELAQRLGIAVRADTSPTIEAESSPNR